MGPPDDHAESKDPSTASTLGKYILHTKYNMEMRVEKVLIYVRNAPCRNPPRDRKVVGLSLLLRWHPLFGFVTVISVECRAVMRDWRPAEGRE